VEGANFGGRDWFGERGSGRDERSGCPRGGWAVGKFGYVGRSGGAAFDGGIGIYGSG